MSSLSPQATAARPHDRRTAHSNAANQRRGAGAMRPPSRPPPAGRAPSARYGRSPADARSGYRPASTAPQPPGRRRAESGAAGRAAEPLPLDLSVPMSSGFVLPRGLPPLPKPQAQQSSVLRTRALSLSQHKCAGHRGDRHRSTVRGSRDHRDRDTGDGGRRRLTAEHRARGGPPLSPSQTPERAACSCLNRRVHPWSRTTASIAATERQGERPRPLPVSAHSGEQTPQYAASSSGYTSSPASPASTSSARS